MGEAFWVPGSPAPQGSKKAVGQRKNGSTILVEVSKKVAPWRAVVAQIAKREFSTPHECPVDVSIIFFMPRPKKTPKGRTHPSVPPDLDKLARSTLDALTKIAFKDDSLVVTLHLMKVYENGDGPGAMITVKPTGT